MAQIPQKIQQIVDDYIKKVSKQIPVKKALLFGSYAVGSFNRESDIDIAVFSDYFETMTRVDGIKLLLLQAMDYEMDLEPHAFTEKEYLERTGIIEEIVRTGIEIPIHIGNV